MQYIIEKSMNINESPTLLLEKKKKKEEDFI